jgi:hypothetical protein
MSERSYPAVFDDYSRPVHKNKLLPEIQQIISSLGCIAQDAEILKLSPNMGSEQVYARAVMLKDERDKARIAIRNLAQTLGVEY